MIQAIINALQLDKPAMMSAGDVVALAVFAMFCGFCPGVVLGYGASILQQQKATLKKLKDGTA